MGYSMGGLATLMSASNEDYVSTWNIGAAIAFHPVAYYKGWSQVPIFLTSGDI
jgi:dienelactone hydrolase